MNAFARWLRSCMRGEVSTSEIESRRRAGGAAYSLAEEAAELAGHDRGTRLFRLCAWNALALQTIADTMLDVDTRDDPASAGYVPRSTLHYVGACLDLVPIWIRASRIVQSDPAAQIAVPSSLPKWRFDEPTTLIELHCLRTAYEALQPRLESDLDALAAAQPDSPLLPRLRRLFAEMTSAADYAGALVRPGASAADRGAVRWRLLDALDNAFLLGQLLAVPTLVDVTPLERETIDRPAMTEKPSWLQIEASWPVVDSDDIIVGHVERARGDHSTGEFEGIDVDPGLGHATVHVPAASVARIGVGEIRLSVPRAKIVPS